MFSGKKPTIQLSLPVIGVLSCGDIAKLIAKIVPRQTSDVHKTAHTQNSMTPYIYAPQLSTTTPRSAHTEDRHKLVRKTHQGPKSGVFVPSQNPIFAASEHRVVYGAVANDVCSCAAPPDRE